MRCPNDQTELQMTERQGIEIDYCPNCRGVWLDRGELDKIIERSTMVVMPSQPAGKPSEWRENDSRRYDDDRYDDDKRYGYEKKKRRSSFLDDLFDF
jgi:Zn-finger nucleic acid-binding protein